MTPLKRGSALLMALLLTVAFSLYPVRVRAMSSAAVALTAVGGATVIAATMAACGIYPYSQDNSSFGEWAARHLTDLVNKYNERAGQVVIQQEALKAYVVGRTLAVARGTWDKLIAFVSWVADTYSLHDDASSVYCGGVYTQFAGLPIYYSSGTGGHPSYSFMRANGLDIRYSYLANPDTPEEEAMEAHLYVLAQVPYAGDGGGGSTSGVYDYPLKRHVCFCFIPGEDGCVNLVAACKWLVPNLSTSELGVNYANSVGATVQYRSFYYNSYKTGDYFTRNGVSYYYLQIPCPAMPHDVEYYSDLIGAKDYIVRYFTQDEVAETPMEGFVVDTGKVSIPEPLSADDDTEWVGLSVYPGTVEGFADTPASPMTGVKVEQVVQQGVMERQRPDVRPVGVTLAPGTALDAETGVVSSVTVTDTGATDTGATDTGATDTGATAIDSGVTVDVAELAENYVPAVSELVPSADFVASVQQYLRTKFPFSLPFDIVDLFSSFVKLPEAPKITVTFHAHPPFLASDYTLTVDLKPWDDVAAVCRQLQAILYLVGFTLAIPKIFLFNNILAGSVI